MELPANSTVTPCLPSCPQAGTGRGSSNTGRRDCSSCINGAGSQDGARTASRASRLCRVRSSQSPSHRSRNLARKALFVLAMGVSPGIRSNKPPRVAPAAAQRSMIPVTERKTKKVLQSRLSRSHVLNYLHAVFATKQRKPTINDPASVWAYMRGIARNCHFRLAGDRRNQQSRSPTCVTSRTEYLRRDARHHGEFSCFIRTTSRLFAWQDGYAAVYRQSLRR